MGMATAPQPSDGVESPRLRRQIAPPTPIMSARSALVLFAHGSRDPEWVRPFEQLRDTAQQQAPNVVVALAYFESAAPDLNHCVRTLAADGVTAIQVLPLFLAMGRHLRTDIPALAERIKLDYPGLNIEFLPALGEAPEFVAALGAIALRVAR
jgi:sirohydrochlorin cobaltochelatase